MSKWMIFWNLFFASGCGPGAFDFAGRQSTGSQESEVDGSQDIDEEGIILPAPTTGVHLTCIVGIDSVTICAFSQPPGTLEFKRVVVSDGSTIRNVPEAELKDNTVTFTLPSEFTKTEDLVIKIIVSIDDEPSRIDSNLIVSNDSESALNMTDRKLVSRYYLDEARSGVSPISLIDAGPNNLNLALDYGEADLEYTSTTQGAGLRWKTEGTGGGGCLEVAGTAAENMLNGSLTGTIEAVVVASGSVNEGSRIAHIGTGVDWNFSLGHTSRDGGFFEFTHDFDRSTLRVADPFDAANRSVITIVLDSGQEASDDRVKFYRNGIEVKADPSSTNPTADKSIDISQSATFMCVGNRKIGERSTAGDIYYVAFYAAALAPSEVANNSAILFFNDDTP